MSAPCGARRPLGKGFRFVCSLPAGHRPGHVATALAHPVGRMVLAVWFDPADMVVPDPDPLAGPIVPGHPLYAQMQAARIFVEALRERGVRGPDAGHMAAVLVARLAQHDPPILFATEHELRQDDDAVLADLVRRGALMGVEVFGTDSCCEHGPHTECESTGYGLCDRFSEHAVGSDCNRADDFLLRPSDALMTEALRAGIHDEGPWRR